VTYEYEIVKNHRLIPKCSKLGLYYQVKLSLCLTFTYTTSWRGILLPCMFI